MIKVITIVSLASFLSLETLALSVSTPVLAQSVSQVQYGDYYAPQNAVVQQPTAQELKQAKQGDYYAPSKAIMQEPTAQELKRSRQGDYYAPEEGN